MAILLRIAPRPGAAPDPAQDRLVEGDVSIGRAATSGLRLLRPGVRFHHAVLREQDSGPVLSAVPGATLRMGELPCDHAALGAGAAAVALGPYLLTPGPQAAAGVHQIIITPVPQTTPTPAVIAAWYAGAYDTALPNIRLMSFAVCCLIAALFFVLPLSFAPGQLGARTAAAADRALAIGTAPAVVPARIDALWNIGSFSTVHSGFGHDCAHCHLAAFMHVPSSTCLNCHRDIGQHADPAVAPAADLDHRRCETCHREHKGPVLATSDRQADCVTCHGDLRAVAPHTRLPDVRDFATDHPQFAPALVSDALHQVVTRVPLGTADPPDDSGLRFTHATHLALAALNKPGDTACATCHLPLPGGVTFARVQFQPACAACHTLQFEPRHPEWRLPHGDPDALVSRIRGFYATATLAGERFAAPSPDLFARPGAPLPPPLQGQALVDNQVAAAMMSSIARSACGQCHTVRPPAAGAPPEAWTVAPVYVNDRFLPSAGFSHASHVTSPCSTCHLARSSDGGPLALLPGIATCRLCHAGEAGAPQRVATGCATCHAFHNATMPLLPAAALSPVHVAFNAGRARAAAGEAPP